MIYQHCGDVRLFQMPILAQRIFPTTVSFGQVWCHPSKEWRWFFLRVEFDESTLRNASGGIKNALGHQSETRAKIVVTD
jgi:hypothetical protein